MRVMSYEFGERFQIKLLRRMFETVVIFDAPAAMTCDGQESAVLTRAVVIDALPRMTVDDRRSSACFISRMISTARERILIDPQFGQPCRRQLRVKRFASVRSACQREMPCAQSMRLVRARLHERYRLYRFQRRARIGYELGVAPPVDDFACCIRDCRSAQVHAFD